MINGQYHPYVQAAIEGEIACLASSTEGQRNQTLFRSTTALASLGLREGEILRHLKPAADAVGLRGKEFYATVKSGVKAGNSKPRQIPGQNSRTAVAFERRPSTEIDVFNSLPARSQITDNKRPAFIAAGDEGPGASSDELRRHVYRRDGRPVRIKIKRSSGAYVNWYRVSDSGEDGWQAAKPDDYVPCPYVGATDPFDPELRGDVLYWPEGEKDCDTLSNQCLPAFTFGGTGDGLPHGIEEYLRGRHVVILADNDPGGREHAAKKAALAHSVAASVKVVEFPELPAKTDVTDYLKSASLTEFERRVADTPFWKSPVASLGRNGNDRSQWRSAVITASDLKVKSFEPAKYVVPGYIPEGVTIFAGKPKVGKSWLLYDVCLASAADRFVLGAIKPAHGDVLYLALEDSQRRLKRRLDKLWPEGAWPARLSLATQWRRADEGGVQDIAEWCDTVQNPVLVVVDTLEKFRPLAKANLSAYTTDYRALADLHVLSHQRALAIVVVHHVRKMEADDPFDMVSGTNGLTGAADTLLVLKRQSGIVTLYSRGRDIEEKETACQFDRRNCRWTMLGDASEVRSSGERAAIILALTTAGDAGMSTREIMVATERSDRNAVDQLLFKMHRDGDLQRVKRGVYAVAGKIDKKERSGGQATDGPRETGNLTNLTDLTGAAALG